jgi:hypothetical protein
VPDELAERLAERLRVSVGARLPGRGQGSSTPTGEAATTTPPSLSTGTLRLGLPVKIGLATIAISVIGASAVLSSRTARVATPGPGASPTSAAADVIAAVEAPSARPSASAPDGHGMDAAPVRRVERALRPPNPPSSASVRAAASVEPVARKAADGVDVELRRERALVDLARERLAAGDAAGARRALASVDAEFPDGRLGEERELLAIQALALSGDAAGASAGARRFRERHPDSAASHTLDEWLTGEQEP